MLFQNIAKYLDPFGFSVGSLLMFHVASFSHCLSSFVVLGKLQWHSFVQNVLYSVL